MWLINQFVLEFILHCCVLRVSHSLRVSFAPHGKCIKMPYEFVKSWCHLRDMLICWKRKSQRWINALIFNKWFTVKRFLGCKNQNNVSAWNTFFLNEHIDSVLTHFQHFRRLLHSYFLLTERRAQNIRITPNKVHVYFFWKVNIKFHIFVVFHKNVLDKEIELVFYAWKCFESRTDSSELIELIVIAAWQWY